jgi:hypothetical protein
MAGKKDIVEQALKLIMGVGEEISPHQRAENLSRFVSGSKLLDDAGNPQRLYHITNKDFDVFKPGGEDPTISGPAIWLSPYAEKQPAMHNVGSGSGFKEGTNVMPVYASIKNPLVLDTPEMQDWARTVFANKSSEFPYLISPEAKKAMQDEGYDGIILSGGSGVDNDEVIAFEGSQIKSAIGNTGAYDPADPRIDRETGGRIAKGLGGWVDDVVKMAGKVISGVGEEAAPVSRIGMNYKDVTKRVPELTEAAKRVQAGEIGQSEYSAMVDRFKPVEPYASVPNPASVDDMVRALTANKREKIGKLADYPEGHPVALRLDIPAYTGHGVWVPTIHDQKTFKSISHEPAAHIAVAQFSIPENKALAVAAGGAKGPFATIDGSLLKTPPEAIHERAKAAMNDPDWVQVGMDPERHSYFYDRKTMQPVISAEEVIQVGPLVLARKPVYGNAESFKYSKGGSIREGYSGKGRVVGDVVDQALKLVTGAAEESAPRIKLRSHDNRPDWDKIMSDIDSQTNPHPFSDRERVFNNRSTFEIRPFENSLHLGDIRALQPNQGAGTELLDFLKGIADKHGVPITGTAKAYHSGPGYIADTDKLADWYRRRGFEIGDGYPEDGYDIIYNPRKQKFSGGRIAKGPGGIIDDVVSMAGKLVAGEGEQAAKTGIRAYHGSPHDFDKFDMSKIGTGEGAQAYGHGLYKTQKSDIGRGYRDSIMAAQGIDPEMKIGKTPINDFYSNMEQRLARIPARQAEEGYNQLALLEDLAYGGDVLYIREKAAQGAYSPQTMDWFEKTISPQFNRKGRLYEVNIAADPNTFLDWDKPLSEQPQNVLNVARPFFSEGLPEQKQYGEIVKGGDLYDMLVQRSGGVMHGPKLDAAGIPSRLPGGTKERLGMYLSSQGIPGIKYLDAGSRGVGDGTRNYVVFDDKLISIIRKYGIAGASAMLGYNLMENLDSKQALAATMADREYKESRPKQAEGGSVENEDSWLDAAMTVARNAADKATFGTSKYAAAGADYLTDAALDALGYENDADFDRALAEQEYAMKEGEEKNPAAAGAGDIIGYVAPYLAIGPAEGALTTLGYLSDYGGKVGKTGSLFARALGFADGGEVPERGYLESVGDAINSAANPIRRVVGVRTVDLPEGMSEVDYGQLLNLAADILNRSMIGFSGADPYAKRPMKMPVSPKGKIVDRVPQDEDDDVNDALRIAKDAGGSTPVLMEDAKGNKYDVNGNIIPPTVTGPNPARSDATPQELGQKAAQDPVMFDEMMRRFAVPDRDIAEYEALRSEVAKQPQAVQQMTHIGAKPRREVTVDMPLLGGEYNLGTAPYDVASGLSGMAQTAYDLKTAPLYMTPFTAPIGAGLDVAEGVATGDPVQASLAALGAPGKFAKAAVIGGSNYLMSPAEAQAGPERWFSKAMKIAEEIPMNKMTGEQALAMLRKGTSPEELRWTGTDVFLQGKPQVTKQELIDYLSKNRVQTQDVVLGGSKPFRRDDVTPSETAIASMKQRWDELSAEYEDQENRYKAAINSGNKDLADAIRAASITTLAQRDKLHEKMIDDTIAEMGGLGKPTKFETHSTPGGQNYEETLITLPKLPGTKPTEYQVYGAFPQSFKTREEAEDYIERINLLVKNSPSTGLARDFAKYPPRMQEIYEKPEFWEGHWDRSDVIAHVRSQILDATTPGANRPFKAWNGDEFQSKWGQEGRDQGFLTNEMKSKLFTELPEGYTVKLSDYQRSSGPERYSVFDPNGVEIGNGYGRDNAINSTINYLNDQVRGTSASAIEEAPYVTSTEGWTDLAIKKSLDKAIDSGSDYFTWTPGEVHAQRYNLGQYVSELHRAGSDLVGFDKNGKQVFTKTGITKEELPKYIGKELAQKLDEAPVEDGWKSITGLDEMVGGRGMIEYYNKVVPRRLIEVIRKATGKKPNIEIITVQTANGPRQQLGIRIDDDIRNARFSDFNKGGRVTGGNSYGNDQSIASALALTREY